MMILFISFVFVTSNVIVAVTCLIAIILTIKWAVKEEAILLDFSVKNTGRIWTAPELFHQIPAKSFDISFQEKHPGHEFRGNVKWPALLRRSRARAGRQAGSCFVFQRMVDFLGLLGKGKLHVVGHSMGGGMTATRVCNRHPESLISATIVKLRYF
jgi:hypothetical protein